MSIHEVFMPALSSTMTEGKIVSWVKSPGDKVEKGETVVVVESDKADMDVETFYEGYLAHIIVQAGDTAPVGSAIAYVVETEAEIATAKNLANSGAAAATPTPTPEPVAASASAPTPALATQNGNNHREGRVVVSPRARKLAKELKVDLTTLQGSGPYGRIVAQDVESSVNKAQPAAAPKPAPTPTYTPAAAPAPAPVVPGQTVPLTTFQNAVVRNMVASLAVPVFRVSYTISTDGLDKLYKQIKSKGVTMTALLAKAVAVTLQKHPLLNASYSDQGIVYHSNINIAVAVAMDDGGLITPVLQKADTVDIYSLSRTWKSLVEKAKAKQLQPEEYNSGTFTLSNLGMFGVDTFDAILPPGQGSILAIGASRPQVIATGEGLFGVRQQMQVNITSDHRIIYGADAAAFLKDLAKLIETNPQSLTM
ncbi:dihydrolipoamide acetyltransferase family protein [Nodularia spumigena CS-584]|jgi:pyruvate dehydrogenase E2 component (dihydrolipoamide acetyltransferase)|uniref:Dihydrolipoamide acetyltransferase component of pyruvate dehydrogenase complex n=3 Tax=Nodularia spumigena TaxID=70799 RepID=A0ABU5UV73_NODSP|nr:dihydrolipoamide acetyltransferase family protein [Nodularia spumigena]AHJ26723.1 Dihydrolipoamide acetyltransferase component of pyruvate dehydrogenase complex [Nodularia spumigena CCY9414]EAW45856.1 dihydrolipoamide acetyltransferase [Nodularia spumigena CCY9414]MDB9382914.1 dihydrolipoamide acetyltransferase family protein [Nodularia spumigena CS-584]MEA5527092.1 dihydrolipoamide acetyltransferase family protein [Nodularia spumigena UHCC 0143]MEA5558426.1 dihydrolipoamide acetyltransfera